VNSKRIYLDHAATTPLRTEVAQAVQEAWSGCDFNPSSLHAEGRRARAAVDDARDRIASAIGAKRSEIVFTSGGTEANNLALRGVLATMDRPAHVAASAVEHHAVLEAVNQLSDDGIETTLVGVDERGRVDPAQFELALRPHTALASIMYANNEVGTVQPIAELAAIAHGRGVLFHTDAVAAPLWLPIDVRDLGVDLLSISAHKFGGPKGAGLLFVREGVPIAPVIPGGGQQSGRRSGTEDVPGIIGLALALELAGRERERAALTRAGLRDRLEAGIRSRVPEVWVNAAGAPRLPNASNVSFAGTDAAALLIALDLAGIAVSAGSACTSGTLEPSHVLAAMAPGRTGPPSGIRFSLGPATTPEEIDRVLAVLPALVGSLRAQGEAAGAAAGGMGRLETNRARLEAQA
jgi:cysteine desulfurase